MGDHEDVLALLDVTEDGALKKWEGAFAGVFEGFAAGRGDVVGSAPDMDLLFAIFFAHIVLIESGKVTVIAFVESLVADDGGGSLSGRIEDVRKGVLGAAQSRGVGDVNRNIFDELAGAPGFGDALFGEGDVHPSGKSVLEVPKRLTVADEDEFRHGPEVTFWAGIFWAYGWRVDASLCGCI